MAPLANWTSPPADWPSLLSRYETAIFAAFATGEYEPVVWPYRSWGLAMVLAYLLLPPTRSRVVRYARFPVFGYFVHWSWRCVRETRSAHMHGSYAVGLIASWSCIWVASLLVFGDVRGTAMRIERRENPDFRGGVGDAGGMLDVGMASSAARDEGDMRQRSRTKHSRDVNSKDVILPRGKYIYYWQPLPETLWHRILWTCDLTTSFRGPGWTFQTASIPPPPPDVLESLPQPHPFPPSPSPYRSRRQILTTNACTFLIGALVIDGFKTFVLYDPYFWGYTSAPLPSYFPAAVRSSAALTHAWRLAASLVGIYTALNFVCSLSPLVYLGLLGERYLGSYAEPWRFPEFFGPINILWEEGLAGWWGRWWHQLFRTGFTSPTKSLLRVLGWEKKSGKAKILGSVMAFGLSAAVHSSGSWTSWPRTWPLGPVLFFTLQGVGVAVETGVKGWVRSNGLGKDWPQWTWKVARGFWVLGWMYATADLLVADFSRSGIWLFEPLPISIFRGLEYGLPHQGWWNWSGTMAWWHTGNAWYKSGIAV